MRIAESDVHRLSGLDLLLELLFQRSLGFAGEICLRRFFPRQLRHGVQLVLDVLGRDAIPITVLVGEHIHFLLFHAEDLRGGKAHIDFVRPHIDRKILVQIEAGFDEKRAVQLDTFGAASPRVQKFVFDFSLAHDRGQLRHLRCLFEVNAVLDGDLRLKVGHVDKRRPQIAHSSRRPVFDAQKDQRDESGSDQRHKNECERPRGAPRSRLGGCVIHKALFPKKIPPPMPDGHEGRLFPPEHFLKLSIS